MFHNRVTSLLRSIRIRYCIMNRSCRALQELFQDHYHHLKWITKCQIISELSLVWVRLEFFPLISSISKLPQQERRCFKNNSRRHSIKDMCTLQMNHKGFFKTAQNLNRFLINQERILFFPRIFLKKPFPNQIVMLLNRIHHVDSSILRRLSPTPLKSRR